MRSERRRSVALLLALALLVATARGQSAEALRVGHWVRVKGAFDVTGRFVATELEVREPADQEALIGTATDVDEPNQRFRVLGQLVRVSDKTEWEGGLDWDTLEGRRLQVEGYYRGLRNLSARELQPRDPGGRDRLEGRIDDLDGAPTGLLLKLMRWEVLVPPELVPDSERPLSSLALAPAGPAASRLGEVPDEEDLIPETLVLAPGLTAGVALSWNDTRQREYDLDDVRRGDTTQRQLSANLRVSWEGNDALSAHMRLRGLRDSDRDADDPNVTAFDGSVAELYATLNDPFALGFDVSVGRQDFDDPREFLYDQNLDAVRARWQRSDWVLDLSASTVLADGGRALRETDRFMAYLSTADDDRHLAAYVIDARRSGEVRDMPLHMGLRLLGDDWLPGQTVWAEAALLRGYAEDVDYRGWALDVGTTIDLEPFSLTVGFAQGSGDGDPTDDVDRTFRQTGLQDNNGRFAGVTSFKYYGELVEPELSNLQVTTLGLGYRLAPKTSLDLVLHGYQLVETVALDSQLFPDAPPLLRSNLKRRPDGVHRDVGWELDLILGSRETARWDFEWVLALFDPGAAFPGADQAWLSSAEVRYRF